MANEENTEYSLINAIREFDFEAVTNLLNNGMCVNTTDYRGYTPLHAAIEAFNLEIFEYLLVQPEVDINARSKSGESPLYLSALWSRHEYALRLLLNGADISIETNNKETPLHAAAGHSDFEMVSMLLYFGASTDVIDCRGYTPFMSSLCKRTDVSVQELLMELEVDYNRTAFFNTTTLLLALECRSQLCVELIERGADVNYVTHSTNALQSSIHSDELFNYIWDKFDYRKVHGIIMNPKRPLERLVCTLGCGTSNDVYLKRMRTIFFSDKGINMLFRLHPQVKIVSFYRFVFTCCDRKIPEDDFYELLCVWLSCGVSFVHSQSLTYIYDTYGFNRILELLLNMRIESHYRFIRSPLHAPSLVDLMRDVSDKSIDDVLVDQIELYRYCDLLRYGTPKDKGRDSFYATFGNDQGWRNSEQLRQVDRKLRSLSVPSLLELGRNAAKRAIIRRYNVEKCGNYYWILNRLPIPSLIKDILSFKVPVNKFED